METTRIALWSGPRNVSTALMYSFLQRTDCQCFDEPLFAYFLNYSGALRPSRNEVLNSMECDAQKVISKQLNASGSKPVVFAKHMANHLLGLDWRFLMNYTNVILTRDPREMIASYIKQMPDPTFLDCCYEMQTKLLDWLVEKNIEPIVLDSKEILLNPENVLKKLCYRVGIEFQSAMLRWPSGPKLIDGVWAKYWYGNLHKSTGFSPYKAKNETLPERLEPLLEQCIPHYERLRDKAIQA